MESLNSVLADLLNQQPHLRSQLYFKSSLTALSHAMEDQVLVGLDQPLIISSFQQERFYRQEAHRYRRIAEKTSHLYVLSVTETEFKNSSDLYETIAFSKQDPLAQEWHIIVLGVNSAACLICREKTSNPPDLPVVPDIEPSRRFEGIWTFDRQVTITAANILLDRIRHYRPELATKIRLAKELYLQPSPLISITPRATTANAFVQRLVTYLQAGQYKLLKAYRSISIQENKERLINSITNAIRNSLKPDEVLQIAIQELGPATNACRCLIYRCKSTDHQATITHQYLSKSSVESLIGQTWNLSAHPLFKHVVETGEPAQLDHLDHESRMMHETIFSNISDILMFPVIYQDKLLGIIELHYCGSQISDNEDMLTLVGAIATQIGSTLIQAESYANLQYLNQQLEALDRTRANLVAITGHELRTPLSTIQVCLESLATEPDMPLELRQVMLSTALSDAERMRKLVQDFLTLSQLESGRVQWHLEALSLLECIDLTLSGLNTRHNQDLPKITIRIDQGLPLIQADGEWLVEVLTKLLDNACKFTAKTGEITIQASPQDEKMLEVMITDNGRGIEPTSLNSVFERFYQEEGALRRTTGGTGLGLAICRQIVNSWGGRIWAESAGKDQGSEFHFTVPLA